MSLAIEKRFCFKRYLFIQYFEILQAVSVLRLLRSVTQVKEEYEVLRQDIQEVQQLQKQLTDSLKSQLIQVHGHFNVLRNRIIGHNRSPQLK